mmetsp:Transcript_70862/g.157599  ORF Transcript_70862/g.157599 Transcript_70862/m.157599 type:complete len:228 (-) Transcript_70862:620-1303(-)
MDCARNGLPMSCARGTCMVSTHLTAARSVAIGPKSAVTKRTSRRHGRRPPGAIGNGRPRTQSRRGMRWDTRCRRRVPTRKPCTQGLVPHSLQRARKRSQCRPIQKSSSWVACPVWTISLATTVRHRATLEITSITSAVSSIWSLSWAGLRLGLCRTRRPHRLRTRTLWRRGTFPVHLSVATCSNHLSRCAILGATGSRRCCAAFDQMSSRVIEPTRDIYEGMCWGSR